MVAYLGVCLATAATVVVTTPLVRRLAVRVGAIDRPADRKVHPHPTPTLGGVAIFLGVLVGLGVAYFTPTFQPVFRLRSELQGVLLAAIAIHTLGLLDDLRALSVPAKVAGQVFTAGLLILNGVQLLFFWFPGQGVVSLGADLAVPLTVIWVLVMVNSINLIDGLDGLAAGIVVIGGSAFFVYAYAAPGLFGQPLSPAPILCAIAVGAALGFLPYNFHPARIFMGDSGSMLLGVIFAAATISGVGRTTQPASGDFAAFAIPVLIPMIVLAVPLLDVAMAIFRRLRRRRPVFAPDKEHIHHQLREIGHTHRQAVLMMYLWSVLLASSALAITFINGRAVLLLILSLVALIIVATLIPARIRRARLRLLRRRGRAGAAGRAVETESA